MLVSAIREPRSSFEQYHGLVATERSWRHLAPADRARVRAAVEEVLDGPLGDRSSDRRMVARRILDDLASAPELEEPDGRPGP